MIPIKIQCGCGGRYTFNFEPVTGQVPRSVSCPLCGVDGTSAANAAIGQYMRTQPAVLASGNAVVATASPGGQMPLRQTLAEPSMQGLPSAPPARHSAVATDSASPSPANRPRLSGPLKVEQAQAEARTRVMWGDEPADVMKFLQTQGYSVEEAKAALAPMLEQRAELIRKEGVRKALVGAAMMCVPVVGYIIFQSTGATHIRSFALTLAIGVWGLWRALSGIIMFVSPRSEKGDVAEI